MKDVTVSTRGKQVIQTPPELIDPVFERWPCWFDLAASPENSQCEYYFTEKDDALNPKTEWPVPPEDGPQFFWLNPPFRKCNSFLARCMVESLNKGLKIVTLTPANRASQWYKTWVEPYALSLILVDRIQFVGEDHIYPKDLMINIFGLGIRGNGYFDFNKNGGSYASDTLRRGREFQRIHKLVFGQ